MRNDIRKLCVTTWGAVLEVRQIVWTHRLCNDLKACLVADTDAIDSGQYISGDDIQLIATVKKLKHEQNNNDNFILPNGNSLWGKNG